MATMYADDSPKNPNIEINEDNLHLFVWEIMRYFGGVPNCPYIKGKFISNENKENICFPFS